MSRGIKDPATYRRMSEPLASQEEANKAVEAFFEDLRALREKHHIRDVVVVAQLAYVDGGAEGLRIVTLTIGSRAEALPMLATAFGHERAQWVAMLDKTAGGVS